MPRVVYFFLIVTATFSLVYWLLFPAFPLGATYTKGLLGTDQRTNVAESLKEAALDRQGWTKRIETESYQAIQADPSLMAIVRQTGRTLFGDNCAACHGLSAKGNKGYPNLTTASWLWGGDPETIAETIRHGWFPRLRLGLAAPEPRRGREVREALAALWRCGHGRPRNCRRTACGRFRARSPSARIGLDRA